MRHKDTIAEAGSPATDPFQKKGQIGELHHKVRLRRRNREDSTVGQAPAMPDQRSYRTFLGMPRVTRQKIESRPNL